ncbi:MAG: hypothetical protein GX587_06310 [Bacteroidales bacterium]|nr:hypothetical protein [Bacteroidales bacterium]
MKKTILAAFLFTAGIFFTAQVSALPIISSLDEISYVDQEPVKEKTKTGCTSTNCTDKNKAACKDQKKECTSKSCDKQKECTSTSCDKHKDNKNTQNAQKTQAAKSSCCGSHDKK